MMKKIALLVFICFLAFISNAQDDYKIKSNQDLKVYNGGKSLPVKHYTESTKNKMPKNIILMIGDGMGVTQVFSGIVANGGDLFLKNFTNIGFSETQSASDFVTDSGAGGTALSTGQRTYNGAIGVDTDSVAIQNIREKAELKGFATGVISTSAITHATPASFVAHEPNRDWYEEIASDFLKTNIDVFIGGGLKNFNARKDGVDLTLQLKKKGFQVVVGIDSISKIKSGKLAGFTSEGHNKSMVEGRGNVLPTATKTAINILSNDPDGFFLMVEGSQIDWGGHQNNTSYIATEMLDFDQAIGEALEFASKNKETLIIVTADHETGGFAIENGNFKNGNIKGNFTIDDHTGTLVPIFAFGPGAEYFRGFHKNTDIPALICKLAGF
ncbi:MAG TPA: alkaline phosphatase [Prolixibacteraceae bacterium]|nr:alkaline phosphatase [Prolixibacteraceae bacterium]HPS13373.1 alkaline phosphatase [Prolixibacteraceae bacterium]